MIECKRRIHFLLNCNSYKFKCFNQDVAPHRLIDTITREKHSKPSAKFTQQSSAFKNKQLTDTQKRQRV
jgi:hypothetical protein